MTDEYLDIVDDNDNVIGRDLRNKIYADGRNHNVRAVNVFIFNAEGKLLLPKRTMNRRIFPGCFDFSCGEHVMSGEDYYQAAERGIKEELDISGEKLTEIGRLTPKNGVSCFMKVYLLNYNKEIMNYDKDGIDKLYWCSLEKIKQLVDKDKSKFKGDFPAVLGWYIRGFKK
jgi:isopentenyl-diphosphate delta-isomerase